MRFPRPRRTVPRRSAGPGIAEASARRGRGGRWPGALGPRRARDQRGAVAGAMAPAMAAALAVRIQIVRALFGRERETHAFPPPLRNAATKTRTTRTDRGQRPTRRARSARRGRGGRWPGALGPRLARDQPGAVAGAMAPAIGAALVVRTLTFRPRPGGIRKRTAFPPPARDSATKTRATRTNRGQRPTRRARSARRGRGGRWPGALGPRLARDQRGAVAGAMAPAIAAGLAVRIQIVRALFGRERETHAFPPPARNAGTRTRATRANRGQRPTRRARSARRGRGGRWPGALGPRLARDQPGAVAGAMAPAMATAQFRPPPGGNRKRTAFPPPARNAATKTRATRTNGRPAPDPAGGKRPPGAGRALAGGFGPRRAKGHCFEMAGAMAPARGRGRVARSRVRQGLDAACMSPADPPTSPRSQPKASTCPQPTGLRPR
jgi:hypothetical protein